MAFATPTYPTELSPSIFGYPGSPERVSSYHSCVSHDSILPPPPHHQYASSQEETQGLTRFAEYIHEQASEQFLNKTFIHEILEKLHRKVREEQFAEWSFNSMTNIFEPIHPQLRCLRPREFCLTSMASSPEFDIMKMGPPELTALHGLGFEVITGYCAFAHNPTMIQIMVRLRAVPMKNISEIPEWFILQAEHIHQEAIRSERSRESTTKMTEDETDIAMLLSKRMNFLA
jgi:hypothetical protein